MTRKFIFVFIIFISVCCMSGYTPKPGCSLSDVPFTVFPHIVKHDNAYFLHYQLTRGEKYPDLKRVVYCKVSNDKAYYFFSIPISHPEYGQPVDRPLADDQIETYAEKDAVYWLNADDTEVKLDVSK